MALEKTAYHLKVEFNDGVTTHNFCAKGKRLPSYTLGEKLDTSTDCSGRVKQFLSADQYEITDMELTLPLDLCLIDQLRKIISTIGTLTITSTYTGVTVTFVNVWISEVTPSELDLDGMGTFTVTFEFGGGIAGTPSLTGC